MTDIRFNAGAQNALMLAFFAARSLGHSYVGSEHILLGIARTRTSVSARALETQGVTEDRIVVMLTEMIGKNDSKSPPISVNLSSDGAALIELSAVIAAQQSCHQVSTEHLLQAIISTPTCGGALVLTRCSVSSSLLQNQLFTQPSATPKPFRPKTGDLKLCLQFGYDMTEKASAGGYDPVIGRQRETERVIQILTRRQKSNPVLLGDAGVGKTAVVEHLAGRIAASQVPASLQNKRIICLNLAQLISGTKYRGEFEERVKSLMEEVKNVSGIILFIDELHMLAGAGAAEGAIDAANIFKPALARSELQVIGASTAEEYKRYIERDAALERRFQPVQVTEPTADQAIEILSALRPKYERHHQIPISTPALEAAVRLSVRHLPDRHLPDKAIDLMDEAAAHASLARKTQTTEIDVAAVLSQMTGIELSVLTQSERDRLLLLPQALEKRVRGQPQAVDAVARAVVRGRALGGQECRPAGSFLFCGPSGVGKTQLARALAECLFGSVSDMIRLDMSELMEKHSVSRLIGSPPGYVGYGEGGYLTEKVRHSPYSVVLLDEVEKAHPDVLNLLLQILEEGVLTDSTGKKASFRNTIIIMTSNVGLEQLTSQKSAGFVTDRQDTQRFEQDVRKHVKQFFRPELLNRIDEIIVFNPLKPPQLAQIADTLLEECAGRLKEVNIRLSWDKEVPEALSMSASDPAWGARPLKREITKRIEDQVCQLWLNGEIQTDAHVTVTEQALHISGV